MVAVKAEEGGTDSSVVGKGNGGSHRNEMQQNKTTSAEEDTPRLSARSHIMLIPVLSWCQ